jgi:hypothetical protein
MAGHIFQARPVWIYTQSNITNIIIKLFHDGLDNGLHVLNRADDVIKEQRYEALKAVTVDKRDCLIVLPTGLGNPLFFSSCHLYLNTRYH